MPALSFGIETGRSAPWHSGVQMSANVGVPWLMASKPSGLVPPIRIRWQHAAWIVVHASGTESSSAHGWNSGADRNPMALGMPGVAAGRLGEGYVDGGGVFRFVRIVPIPTATMAAAMMRTTNATGDSRCNRSVALMSGYGLR